MYRFFTLVIASVLGLAEVSVPADARPLDLRSGEQVYSVALHMHGSFSEGSGSWEWHNDLAQQYGVDLLWWTDHDWRVEHWRHTRGYDFEASFFDIANQRFEEPDDAYPGEFRYIALGPSPHVSHEVTLVDTVASQGTQSLRILLEQPFPDDSFSSGTLLQTTSFLQNMYSLAHRVRVKFALLPEVFDPLDAKFILQIKMSEHPTEQHVLRYVIGSMDEEGPDAIPLSLNPGVWNQYDLDLTADAINRFSSGGIDSLRAEDNSLFRVEIIICTRNGHTPRVFFDDYRIEADSTLAAADHVAKQQAMASYYSSLYPPVSNFVGTEISHFRAQPHLNGYAPNLTLVDYGTHTGADSIFYAIDQIHDQQGAVSLNHQFGVSVYGDPAETEENKASRIQYTKSNLITSRAYDVDVLEVGYRWRGGIPMQGHLDLWDTLNGNAIFLTGNGVSDSHGPLLFHGWGPWQPTLYNENNFVTWMYTTEFSEAGFIESMKSGRAFFGDPYRYDGTIDLVADDGFPMGRIVLTDRSSHDVFVTVTNVPPDVEVRLLQAEIRDLSPVPYLDVNSLRDEILPGAVAGGVFSDTVTIDTTVPSFVRVEVRDGSGEEWAFSNPLHFVDQPPAAGISAARLGARLGSIRITRAEDFTLFGATLDAAPHLLVTGDEEGAGLLEIECSALGSPSAVTGTANWQFVDGILTLEDFDGGGSVVEVFWGVVGAPVRPDRDLTLAAGCPNPFGEGVTASFSLPAAQHVRLEVFDVQGRRIRTLLDESRRSGSHRVEWDGRDDTRDRVANGVYLLRMTAAGRVLTTKIVKVR